MGSKLSGDTNPAKMLPFQKAYGTWKPEPVETPCCKDTIWSTYEGQYQTCFCGKSSIDQTEYYQKTRGELARKQSEDIDNV